MVHVPHNDVCRILLVALYPDRFSSGPAGGQGGGGVGTHDEAVAGRRDEAEGLRGAFVDVVSVGQSSLGRRGEGGVRTDTRPCVGSDIAWKEKPERNPEPT